MDQFLVVVGAGSWRSALSDAVSFPHRWTTSTGIIYGVEVESPASAEELARLLDRVDEVAEIPRAIRAGAAVQRG